MKIDGQPHVQTPQPVQNNNGVVIESTNVADSKTNTLTRRKSTKPGDFDLTDMPEAGTKEFDEHAQREMNRLFGWVKELSEKVTEGTLLTKQNTQTTAQHEKYLNTLFSQTLNTITDRLDVLTVEMHEEQSRRTILHEQLEQVAVQAGASAVMSQDALACARGELLQAIVDVKIAEQKRKTVRPEGEKLADETIAAARKTLIEQTMAYLAIKAQQKFDALPQNLPMVKIEKLQQQLAESIRKSRSDKPVAGWSWRTMFSTDKNARALASVEKLANNAAFSKLGTRTDEELEVNADLIELMMLATYALTNFNKTITAPANVQTTHDDESESDVEEECESKDTVVNTIVMNLEQSPVRKTAVNSSLIGSSSATRKVSPLKAAFTPSGEIVNEAASQEANEENAINKAVIDVIRQRLADIQTRADGLIGTQNPSRQFWGKVLMTLAIAITVTLAAVALMTTLGFATPAFLVPYITAVQSTSVISAVLNFVAAKLTLDLNAAAAVTVATTAGAFGVFGKGLHMSGAPTSLKRDLDKAAQDMEAALKDTEVARSTTPAMR